MSVEAAAEAGDRPCSQPTLDAWSWIARARAAAHRAVQPAEPAARGVDDETGKKPEDASG